MKRAARGEPLNISAHTWNKVSDLVSGAGGFAPGGVSVGGSPLGAGWVYVKNTSGADRSRFDCMSLGTPLFTIETNARQDLVFQLTAAALDKTPVILLEPIANNRYGRAALLGLSLASLTAASSAAMRAAVPDATTHTLKPAWAGPVKLLTAPSTSAATLAPVLVNSFDERGVHFYNTGLAIAAFNTSTKQMGSGTVRRYKSNATGLLADTGEDITVYNAAGEFSASKFGYAEPNDAGLLVITVELC